MLKPFLKKSRKVVRLQWLNDEWYGIFNSHQRRSMFQLKTETLHVMPRPLIAELTDGFSSA